MPCWTITDHGGCRPHSPPPGATGGHLAYGAGAIVLRYETSALHMHIPPWGIVQHDDCVPMGAV